MPGHVVLPEPLPAALVDRLADDADRYVFTAPHPRAGGAFAMAALRGGSAPAAVAEWVVRRAEENGFGGFAPNEASYQRYEATGNGLPPHRDQRFYVGAIAIVTVEGSATFAAHGSRAPDDVVAQWSTGPGQVVLLRGWAPGEPDPRPYHRVDPPAAGSRLMFQLRRNVAAAGGVPAELTATEGEQARTLAATPEAPRR